MAAQLGVSHGLVLLFLLLICLSSAAVAGRPVTRQRLDVRRHLKRLNKPALNSIESPDGDIIDCVHISQQLAFDHPFLQNHTIQMRPSFHPEGLYDENKVAKSDTNKERKITQLWHTNGKCP